jgi:molecular chaperone HscA
VSIKRFLGRSLADIRLAYPNLPYDFDESNPNSPLIKVRTKTVNPIEVTAEILSTLRFRDEGTLGEALSGAVVTVPAYFDDAQRQSPKDAAQLAGLKVLHSLNEATAAAIAYGLDSGQEAIIVVYEGGGTFDISILRLSKGVFEVLSTGGDPALGGDDFDLMLVQYMRQQTALQSKLSPRLQRTLLDQAKLVKEALSDSPSFVMELVDDNAQSHHLTITREQFEQLITGLVKTTLRACRRALKDVELTKDEVLDVIMVGAPLAFLWYEHKWQSSFLRHHNVYRSGQGSGYWCGYSG